MASCPASLKTCRTTSLRKSCRDTSSPSPDPQFQTLLAHFSNSVSWVTPRSRVTASYLVRPGDLREELGSPPSRCSTTSVVRLRPPTLLMPATGAVLPSQKTRNLKFLYGSNRCALTLNWAIAMGGGDIGFAFFSVWVVGARGVGVGGGGTRGGGGGGGGNPDDDVDDA